MSRAFRSISQRAQSRKESRPLWIGIGEKYA